MTPGLDVLLIDLALPDGNGVELIRRSAYERLPAISKSSSSASSATARSVVRAIEAGADGYLLKGAGEQQAEEAIRSVLGGGAPISPVGRQPHPHPHA